MSNSLDRDQARHFVGPDQGPNCLLRLTADDTSRQRVNFRYILYEPLTEKNVNCFAHWKF